MSVNVPPSSSSSAENGADQGSRSSRSTYEEGRSRQASENLRSDLSSLKTDLDALVARSSSLSERELSDAYARMMTKFGSMRFAARGIAAEARTQLNQGVDRTSDYVRAKPLQSVAIAAGAGLLLGMLAARR